MIVLRVSKSEWIRAEAGAQLFEANGKNFPALPGLSSLAHMGVFGHHSLFDRFVGKAVLAVEFECSCLHHHCAGLFTRSVGFGNQAALHIPASQGQSQI